jgi:phosphoenolpyruvate-protein phosphotransferase
MTERHLPGLPAAGGIAVGRALVLRDVEADLNGSGGEAEQLRALASLAGLAAELGDTADRLRAEGRIDEADIFDANRLMAEDPALAEEVRALAAETSAAGAVLRATERHAQKLEEISDETLAARAADVRSLGVRAARLLTGAPAIAAPLRPTILIARDLGPADIADLDLAAGRIRGLALAGGGATSHAAIMARALGVPLVVGLGDEILEATEGDPVVLDGEAGMAILDPSQTRLDEALREVHRRRRRRRELVGERTLPAVTRDGRRIRLLCNAATAAEVTAGLAAGAEGVGLLRTELAFLEAPGWPTEDQHVAALTPALAPLAGRIATVRTLDFGADKTPPFLAGVQERGLALSLAYPDAFAAQLRAILAAGAGTSLRVLLPMVGAPEELRTARAVLEEQGWSGSPPQLGAMIETPEAAARADEIAAEADFLSIGTNDMVQYTLGLDRERPLATVQAAADPAVLRCIGQVVAAARKRGLAVEVCGEAAGEPELVALLVGLGVDELSVSPARLDEVRATIRGVSAADAREAAAWALEAQSARQSLAYAVGVLSVESRHERDETVDGRGGVVA